MAETHISLSVPIAPAKPERPSVASPPTKHHASLSVPGRSQMWERVLGGGRSSSPPSPASVGPTFAPAAPQQPAISPAAAPIFGVAPPVQSVVVVTGDTPAANAVKRALESRAIVAFVVFALTAVLLVAINPPIAQQKTADGKMTGNRSWQKIFVWSLLVGVLAFILPYGASFVGKAS
jgi:hypothetical protein